MKKSYFKVIAGIVLAIPFCAEAQVTTPTNVAGGGIQYAGWDGTGGNSTPWFVSARTIS